MMLQDGSQNDEWIMLNVGGKIFTTTRTTLCTNEPNSMLARMFSQHQTASSRTTTTTTTTTTHSISMRPSPRDAQGAYLIDRSPKYFEPILNYLRHGKLIIDHNVNIQGVLEEAKFYGIVSILPLLELETERWFKKKHQDLLNTSSSSSTSSHDQLHNHLHNHLNNPQQQQQIHNFNHNTHHQHYLNNQSLTCNSSTSSSSLHHQAPITTTAASGGNYNPQYNNSQVNNFDSQYLTSGGADGTQLQTMPPMTRQDVIRALVLTTGQHRGLRFQGCNLNGANLSKLDLRHINFKYANLRNTNLKGANISGANFERADLYQSNLEGSQLIGTNLAHANLENSNLRAITVIPQDDGEQLVQSSTASYHDREQQHQQQQYNCFHPQNGSCRASIYPRANFESANLRNTNLEGSRLAEANLRMASLRGSNLQNCDLTRAILTGADLENCDLSGCDLNEANLRKANVKGVQFELEVL